MYAIPCTDLKKLDSEHVGSLTIFAALGFQAPHPHAPHVSPVSKTFSKVI